jgi:UDP-glucose 4-epimerase
MAADASVPYAIDHPVESTDNNILATVSVLDAAVRNKVRRVVYSASASAYGNQQMMPLQEDMSVDLVNPYALQKYVGELLMRTWAGLHGIETVSLRYFNVYGPGMNPTGAYALAVSKFLQARVNKMPITIFGDGTVTRDFVHVSDIVRANVLAMTSQHVGRGEVINIGTGEATTIQSLAEMFGGDIQYSAPRVEGHDSRADTTRAHDLLGWKSTISLADGIAGLKASVGIV